MVAVGVRGDGWVRRAGRAVGDRLRRLVYRLILTVVWPFRNGSRLLITAWIVGFFAVGQAQTAFADEVIVGPGAPNGSGPTPFETVPVDAYSLPVYLSGSHHGAPYVEQTMWSLINAICNVLIYLTFSLIKGAITCMQWMLQLNLYRENQNQIDSAVQGLANQIFWPLFATTLAVAGMVMFVRKNREGGGSIVNDLVWILAASVLAVTFAGIPGDERRYTPEQQEACNTMGECPVLNSFGPSAVMGDLDDLRRLIATGAIKGYTSASATQPSAAGFKEVEYPQGGGGNAVTLDVSSVNAVRKLADSMWNVYAVTPWCYTMFNSQAACKHDSAGLGEGAHYLARDEIWAQRATFLADNQEDGEHGDQATCPTEWVEDGQTAVSHSQCDWVRGQSFGRLGMTVLLAFVSIPMALLLLALVLYGVMAIVGFILLILVGLLFLLGWMIPGRMRQIGIRWFETVLASLLQSVIITTVLGAVMVLGGILNSAIPTYGYFMVVLLHFAVFFAAFKVRGSFESITQMSSPTSTAPVSQYMAMKMLGGLGKAGRAVSSAPGAVARGGHGVSSYVKDTAAGRRSATSSSLAPLARQSADQAAVAVTANTGRRFVSAPSSRAAAAGSRPLAGIGRGAAGGTAAMGGSSTPMGTQSGGGGGVATMNPPVGGPGATGEGRTSGARGGASVPPGGTTGTGSADRYAPRAGLRPLPPASSTASPSRPGQTSASTGTAGPGRTDGDTARRARTSGASGAATGGRGGRRSQGITPVRPAAGTRGASAAQSGSAPQGVTPVRPAAPSAGSSPQGGSSATSPRSPGRSGGDGYRPSRSITPPAADGPAPTRAVSGGGQPSAPAPQRSTPAPQRSTPPPAPPQASPRPTPPAARPTAAPAPSQPGTPPRPAPRPERATPPPAAQPPAAPRPRRSGLGPWRSQPPPAGRHHRRPDEGGEKR